MVGDILQPTHLLLILLVALLVLGPKRLPEVGRSLGKGLRDFRGAMSGIQDQTSGFLNLEEPETSMKPDAPVNAGVSGEETPSVAAAPAEVTGTVAASAEPSVTATSAKASTASAPVGSSDVTSAAEAPASPARTGAHEPDPSEYAD